MVTPFLDDWLVPVGEKRSDIIEVHTSDRALFKRCRRKWNWQSGMRENYVPLGQVATPLWFGSGWHFILEDWHGARKFPTIDHAIVAYKDAHKHAELPDDIRDHLDLMAGMAHYYTEDWLRYHPEEYETLVIDGVPQVEVDVDIDITERLYNRAVQRMGRQWADWMMAELLKERPVIYRMTFDRVVITPDGWIRIVDYKTARQIDTEKLSNDPQVGAYYWGGAEFYGDQLDGIVWQQFLKAVPQEPEWLSSSQRFSLNKNQATTYPMYRRAVKEKYGKIPAMYNDFLGWLGSQQGDWGDRFIRRDILRRNPHSRRTEEEKILDEVLDMIDPNLPLYPNPTRDCRWDCPFKDPCIGMDDGSDYQFMLDTSYEKWRGYKQDWKKRIIFPDGTRYA